MSNIREAAVSVPMCKETGKPVWASFTLKLTAKSSTTVAGVCLPDGTSVRDAVKTAISLGVEAVLFNCVAPELIDLALPIARKVIEEEHEARKDRPPLRLGAYGNFWTTSDRDNWSISQQESESGKQDQTGTGMVVRTDLTAEPYAKMGEVWFTACFKW
eukprot:gnl/MRDRNA2_/MRDRNA2_67550_c0_seq3.p1 gnl/MRDRNA2_/MRDRNA2_67550_c0~~gnl/MRDRNA2_/MRDRNA2_67550_c0_seq3.p1  ORF type:complete len:159 (+),score=21.81 gnl/MRDRNA2_/MRDRNA2_67550_c0_seq3:565-1041(+)